jgi:oligopeptide/dipeptide ABC transporter ATP-binding protein
MKKPLLEIKNLKTYFFTKKGVIKAVDGVSLEISDGETIAIVGESGSGKSITALSVLQLLEGSGKIVDGSIEYAGKNLRTLSIEEMQKIRGKEISMIFQEPMTSLNPVFKIGEQIEEVLLLHENLNKKEARLKAIEMLKLVGIPRADEIANSYPHQLSGGMRQRVMIAIALACRPKLLIADEPTTALDVTIQAQILHLINKLKNEMNTAVLMITHDLAVVAQMADHILIMYCGQVMEKAPIEKLFDRTLLHPYSQGLLNSIPDISDEKKILETIEGTVPNPLEMPPGCSFAPRCKKVTRRCSISRPELKKISENHFVRCFEEER